jgi:mRNA-degrading endonuclease toxin of MazEF toxin-antitoxin module
MVMRGEVWLVALDSTLGNETQKRRPCLVVSPSEMHEHPYSAKDHVPNDLYGRSFAR